MSDMLKTYRLHALEFVLRRDPYVITEEGYAERLVNDNSRLVRWRIAHTVWIVAHKDSEETVRKAYPEIKDGQRPNPCDPYGGSG